MSITIAFSGDVSFSGIFSTLHDSSFVSEEIKRFLSEADHSVFNIEGPLTSSASRDKKGVSLSSGPEKNTVLKELGCDIFNLANNHIMDCGIAGLEDTLAVARTNDQQAFGAGTNLQNASAPLFLHKEGIAVALIAVAHPEGPLASSTSPGIFCDNQRELIKKAILECKKRSDAVILNYHGGEEFTFVPMPRRRMQFIEYIDWGADVVIGHHPHVVQGYEMHNGKHIFYSLGNFIFNLDSHRACLGTDESVLLKLIIDKNTVAFDACFTKSNLNSGQIMADTSNAKFFEYSAIEYGSLWEMECLRTLKHHYISIKQRALIANPSSHLRFFNAIPCFFHPPLKMIKFLLSLRSFRHVNQWPKLKGCITHFIRKASPRLSP
ncbi:MAG: CapA family protein [Clostridiaceae bacterium]|nr:CapA family protein [Clostridiaceae bacterium]